MANTKISALPTFTGDTTGVYVVIDNAGLTQTYKVSIDALLGSLSGITTSNDVRGRYLISTNATANEGGEIQLAKPPNSILSGGTTIDAYIDRLRFFEQGGNARGAYIDLSTAPSGVGFLINNRVSGLVNAGTFVTMDNIKATLTSSGNRGLSLAAVTGSFSVQIGGNYAVNGGSNGSSGTGTINTTPSSSQFGWNFGANDISTYIITDTTNNRVYRITLQVGVSLSNNFISIERLY